MAESKNDVAWNELFLENNILERIKENGIYQISAATINRVREARLMAKFDYRANLPEVFRKNKLAILPVSRSNYVIGRFDAYAEVKYEVSEKNSFYLPDFIESINYDNLYSESSALHCAYISGIINDLMDEEALYTVSGRMSSNKFDFKIKSVDQELEYLISVENSQTEIDGGFESRNAFMIIEAKNYSVEDFLIRQLYYPYRLWQSKLRKEVIPVFMTYSNDIFSFFVYKFDDFSSYNSLRLLKQKHYRITSEQIVLKDIYEIFKEVKIIEEPRVPFPQADKFERIVDLLGLLFNNDLSKEQLTNNYQFDERQTDYYANAAIYLGLVDKYKNSDSNEIFYTLSREGLEVMKSSFKMKYLLLVKYILQHEVFYRVLEKHFKSNQLLTKEVICEIMRNCYIYNVNPDSSTIERRAQTVNSWINWILSLGK